MVKLSKMHRRVLSKTGKKSLTSTPLFQPLETTKNEESVRQMLEERNANYVAYMSQSRALAMAHKDAYVISIRNKNSSPYVFDCKKQLTLYLDAYGKPDDESILQFKEFFREVLKEERIIVHIHCSFGETRSASIAEAISYCMLPEHRVLTWQIKDTGKWVTDFEMTSFANAEIYHAFGRTIRELKRE